MGLLTCIFQVLTSEDRISMCIAAVSGVLEIVLLWGVCRNRAKLLRIAMYISIIHLTFDFGTILVSPVYFACQVASGYEWNATFPMVSLFLGSRSEEEDRFIVGLVAGYSVEILSTLSVFLGILQFILINRCYVYAQMMEEGVFKHRKNIAMRF